MREKIKNHFTDQNVSSFNINLTMAFLNRPIKTYIWWSAMWRVYNSFRNIHQVSKVQLKFLEKNRHNICFQKVTIYITWSQSHWGLSGRWMWTWPIWQPENMACSEADFLIIASVNILCWNGVGSYAWGKIWLLCYFLREQMLISWIESSGQHVAAQLELRGRRTCVVTAEGVFIPVAR